MCIKSMNNFIKLVSKLQNSILLVFLSVWAAAAWHYLWHPLLMTSPDVFASQLLQLSLPGFCVSLNGRPTCTHTLSHTLHKPCSLSWTFCKQTLLRLAVITESVWTVAVAAFVGGSALTHVFFFFFVQMKRLEDIDTSFIWFLLGQIANRLLESFASKAFAAWDGALGRFILSMPQALVNMCKSLKQCSDLEKDGGWSRKGANMARKKTKRTRVQEWQHNPFWTHSTMTLSWDMIIRGSEP